MSLRLPNSRAAWAQPDFQTVLLAELQQAGALLRPLQQGITRGSHALTDDVCLMVLQRNETAGHLQIRVGLSYFSIIPGCACEADPTPMSEIPEYAELLIDIRRDDASARVQLLPT